MVAMIGTRGRRASGWRWGCGAKVSRRIRRFRPILLPSSFDAASFCVKCGSRIWEDGLRLVGRVRRRQQRASSVFPSSTVYGGSGSVSGLHSWSTCVGLGRGVQRTRLGRLDSGTRRSEDETQGRQGMVGSTARRPGNSEDGSTECGFRV